MTHESDFDRIAEAWLADGPAELPERVLDAVVDEIHLTRQRRAVRAPWRFPVMTTPSRVGAAAVVGILAVGGLLLITRPGQSAVAGPSPNSGVAATASQTAVASVVSVPPLTGTFASSRHGYTVRYPAAWTATPATESWKTSTWTAPGDPTLDAISSADARLSVASQPRRPGSPPTRGWRPTATTLRPPRTSGRSRSVVRPAHSPRMEDPPRADRHSGSAASSSTRRSSSTDVATNSPSTAMSIDRCSMLFSPQCPSTRRVRSIVSV